ncbi:MAG: type IV pilus biogenesis/stability protein PilW [Gammaproteobacteria bacterium]|nr:type IV pilus biogenesis/stability protein PilW [Gammaproteobacteria bacterium]
MPATVRVLLMLFTVATLTACGTGGGTRSNPRDDSDQVRLARIKTDLGLAYLREGRNETALDRLHEALDLAPDFAPAHVGLGLLYARLGKDADAEQHFRRALRESPEDPTALNNFGLFLCQRQQVDEAIGMFDKAAANPLYESPEIAWNNAGTCLFQAGRQDDAESQLRRALRRNPRIPPALLQMASISYNHQDYLGARGFLQRYLEIASHTASSLWLGIRVEQALNNRDAVASYGLLLNRNYPDSEEARRFRDLRQDSR